MSEGHDAPTRPNCWILVGLPASGKTTWRNRQVRRLRCQGGDPIVVSTDNAIETIATALGTTYAEAFHLVDHDALANRERRRFREAIQQRRDIIIDRLNHTQSARAGWLSKLPGYRRTAVVFLIEPDLQADRLALRAQHGKAIPASAIEKMRREFVVPTTSEGFDVVWFRPTARMQQAA
jgi:tRNA uridine 5-carbamoylmethylation protein Kti12